jgi:3-hydroxyacyl-[acyl-carrier-protein] dehydratase
MKFVLVDRIETIERPARIVTRKNLSLAEEYLADHFPIFPILPGVLMIESAVQAAAWLVRVEQDWSRSAIVLSAARNVKYTSFVKPGSVMRCEIAAKSIEPDSAKVTAATYVDDRQTMSARLELRCFNLADRGAHLAGSDATLIEQLKAQFALVGGPEALSGSG